LKQIFLGKTKNLEENKKVWGSLPPNVIEATGLDAGKAVARQLFCFQEKIISTIEKYFFYRKCNGFYKSLSKSAFWAYNIHFLAKHRISPVFSTIVPMA